jgi:hypothetical protein
MEGGQCGSVTLLEVIEEILAHPQSLYVSFSSKLTDTLGELVDECTRVSVTAPWFELPALEFAGSLQCLLVQRSQDVKGWMSNLSWD